MFRLKLFSLLDHATTIHRDKNAQLWIYNEDIWNMVTKILYIYEPSFTILFKNFPDHVSQKMHHFQLINERLKGLDI